MRRRVVVRRGEEVGSEKMREVRGRGEVVLMMRLPLVAPLLQLLSSENSLDFKFNKWPTESLVLRGLSILVNSSV